MTRITIEIPYKQDLGLLLKLLSRLNYQVVEQTVIPETSNPPEEIRTLILKGLPAREDLDEFLEEFEVSKRERKLPGREN
jgi:hypothetical protein